MKTIGIIGIKGRYGTWLERFFTKLGYGVIGSDRESKFSNEQVVQQADVVIFSINIRETVKVIEQLAPLSRSSQLWLDVTSVKLYPVRAMLQSSAQVVGLHPMFAPPPTLSLKNQRVIVYRARCDDDTFSWLMSVLEESEAKVRVLTPARHDRLMVPVQGAPQIGAVLTALTMKSMGLTMNEAFDVASPVFRVMLSTVGRILSQPELYVDILAFNPEMIVMLELMQECLAEIYQAALAGDIAKLDSLYIEAAGHVTPDHIAKSVKLFQAISKLVADLSKGQSITVVAAKDEPGLLRQVLEVLERHHINLTACHSFPVGDGSENHGFVLGLSQSIGAPEVCAAVTELKLLPWVREIS